MTDRKKTVNFIHSKWMFKQCKQLCWVCRLWLQNTTESFTMKKLAKQHAHNNFSSRMHSSIKSSKLVIIIPALFNTGFDSFLVFPPVFFEELCRHWVRWRIWVWVAQQRLNGGQNSSDIVSWAPPRIEMLLKIWVSNEKCDGATPGCSA